MEAAESDFAVTYNSSAAHSYAKDTWDKYSAALRRLAIMLRWQPGAMALECLQDHLLGIIRTMECDSGVKRVLSAVRVLEAFRWVAPIVCPMDWKLVEAVAAFHDVGARTSSGPPCRRSASCAGSSPARQTRSSPPWRHSAWRLGCARKRR